MISVEKLNSNWDFIKTIQSFQRCFWLINFCSNLQRFSEGFLNFFFDWFSRNREGYLNPYLNPIKSSNIKTPHALGILVYNFKDSVDFSSRILVNSRASRVVAPARRCIILIVLNMYLVKLLGIPLGNYLHYWKTAIGSL